MLRPLSATVVMTAVLATAGCSLEGQTSVSKEEMEYERRADRIRDGVEEFLRQPPLMETVSRWRLLNTLSNSTPMVEGVRLRQTFDSFSGDKDEQIPSLTILAKVLSVYCRGLSKQFDADLVAAEAYQQSNAGAGGWWKEYVRMFGIGEELDDLMVGPVNRSLVEALLRRLLKRYPSEDGGNVGGPVGNDEVGSVELPDGGMIIRLRDGVMAVIDGNG